MANLTDLDGIGDAYAARLVDAGIETIGQLFNFGATPAGREKLAERTGISPKRILKWVNHVDHFRVLGIKDELSKLLEACGIDSIQELAKQDALDLFEELVEENKGKKYVKRVPSPREVEDWIKAANKLPEVLDT